MRTVLEAGRSETMALAGLASSAASLCGWQMGGCFLPVTSRGLPSVLVCVPLKGHQSYWIRGPP